MDGWMVKRKKGGGQDKMSVSEKEWINNKIRPIFSVLVQRKQEQKAGGDKKTEHPDYTTCCCKHTLNCESLHKCVTQMDVFSKTLY